MTNTIDSKKLPSFAEAKPLGPSDGKFVAELRDLLEKHGNLDRFGLCLLHDHFPVAADEVLMETNDPARRTLTVTPELTDSLPEFKATMWRLHKSSAARESSRTLQVLQGVPCRTMQACAQDKCK